MEITNERLVVFTDASYVSDKGVGVGVVIPREHISLYVYIPQEELNFKSVNDAELYAARLGQQIAKDYSTNIIVLTDNQTVERRQKSAHWIPREANTAADELSKTAVDRQKSNTPIRLKSTAGIQRCTSKDIQDLNSFLKKYPLETKLNLMEKFCDSDEDYNLVDCLRTQTPFEGTYSKLSKTLIKLMKGIISGQEIGKETYDSVYLEEKYSTLKHEELQILLKDLKL